MADQNFDWYGKWLKSSSREIKIRDRSKRSEGLLKKMLKTAGEADKRLEEKSREAVQRNISAEGGRSGGGEVSTSTGERVAGGEELGVKSAGSGDLGPAEEAESEVAMAEF